MFPSFTQLATHRLFDGLAIILSGLCLLHCLALPLALIALPNLSLIANWPEAFHVVAAVLAGGACGAAVLPRWDFFSVRQKQRIGICAGLGLLFLLGALFLPKEAMETIATVIGSFFLIAAHIQNLRA